MYRTCLHAFDRSATAQSGWRNTAIGSQVPFRYRTAANALIIALELLSW